MLIKLGTGLLAALVAGVALGVASRALMALVALAADGSTTFTWGGTVLIVMLYVLVMVPGGAVAGLTTRRWRWLLPIAGALLICVPAIGIAVDEVGPAGGFSAAQWLGVGTAGAAVFATIGLLPLLTVRLADRWLRRRRPAHVPAPRAGSAAEAVGGAPAVRAR